MLAISSMRSSLFRAEVSLLVPLRLLRPSWNLDFERCGAWGRVVGGGGGGGGNSQVYHQDLISPLRGSSVDVHPLETASGGEEALRIFMENSTDPEKTTFRKATF